MKSVRETIAFGLGLLVMLAVVAHCSGCSPEPKLPAYCTDEALFTAALVRCVDAAKSREESKACRQQVHNRCGIAVTISERSKAP